MWHHTASGKSMDGAGDATYCAEGDEDAPLANAYIDRSGTVWCLAAGATNTNGSGYALKFSKGTVPDNSMNSYAFGVELGNDGRGEQWPSAQIDAMFLVSNTVNQKLGNKPDDVCTHQKWAPDRKVDPATASAVQGKWKPGSCTSSGTWNCEDIKAECLSRAGARPFPPDGSGIVPPTLIPKDDDTMLRAGKNKDSGNAYYIGDGITATWVGGDDKKSSNLLVCAGVIDVVSEKVVYSWSNVGAMSAADIKKYVGNF